MRHPARAETTSGASRLFLAGLAAMLVACLSGCVVVNADDDRDGMHGDSHPGDSQDGDDFSRGDVMFARMMIPHHEQAIDMAEQHQEDGENPEALELSASIIESQTAEIERMRDLLAG